MLLVPPVRCRYRFCPVTALPAAVFIRVGMHIHNIIIRMYAYEQAADRIQPPLDGSTACPTIINPPLFAPLPKIRD